jgi:hypothetical protein
MELDGYVDNYDQNQTNWIAEHNQKALNQAHDFGLWGGRVKMVQFGANAGQYDLADRPSTDGAMFNCFLGIEANILLERRCGRWQRAFSEIQRIAVYMNRHRQRRSRGGDCSHCRNRCGSGGTREGGGEGESDVARGALLERCCSCC